MKASLLVAISIVPVVALADDPLPKRPDFNRYKAMLDRSPFAVATVAVRQPRPISQRTFLWRTRRVPMTGDLSRSRRPPTRISRNI
jgi:hypothetical protein